MLPFAPPPRAGSLRALRRRALGLALVLVPAAAGMPAQQMVTETRDPAQAQDEDFARSVQEWTTQPYFISPLVDHLPKVSGVPSPKDVLGYHIGAPAKLTYYADIPVPGVPYWGKYVFHDNNRDINLSWVSMRITDWYFTAHPPIVHDLHESQPLLYTCSGAAPQNPNLDPIRSIAGRTTASSTWCSTRC